MLVVFVQMLEIVVVSIWHKCWMLKKSCCPLGVNTSNCLKVLLYVVKRYPLLKTCFSANTDIIRVYYCYFVIFLLILLCFCVKYFFEICSSKKTLFFLKEYCIFSWGLIFLTFLFTFWASEYSSRYSYFNIQKYY